MCPKSTKASHLAKKFLMLLQIKTISIRVAETIIETHFSNKYTPKIH
jgi:hypothetical protein